MTEVRRCQGRRPRGSSKSGRGEQNARPSAAGQAASLVPPAWRPPGTHATRASCPTFPYLRTPRHRAYAAATGRTIVVRPWARSRPFPTSHDAIGTRKQGRWERERGRGGVLEARDGPSGRATARSRTLPPADEQIELRTGEKLSASRQMNTGARQEREIAYPGVGVNDARSGSITAQYTRIRTYSVTKRTYCGQPKGRDGLQILGAGGRSLPSLGRCPTAPD